MIRFLFLTIAFWATLQNLTASTPADNTGGHNACPLDATEAITLPKGTRIALELQQNIKSSRARTNDQVRLTVVKDVVVDGKVVIKAGAFADGRLTQVRRKGWFGRSGLVALDITGVYAIDGQRVTLEEVPRIYEEEGRTGLSLSGIGGIAIAAVSLGQPWFLPLALIGAIIPGRDVAIPVKSGFSATVAKSIKINE